MFYVSWGQSREEFKTEDEVIVFIDEAMNGYLDVKLSDFEVIKGDRLKIEPDEIVISCKLVGPSW